MRPLPLLILWYIFGVMVGGMDVDWGFVNQEQNQKITTIKTADNEDSTTTERADSSPDSTNLSGT